VLNLQAARSRTESQL